MNEIQGLYERYATDVYRFSLYLSGSQQVAEDITAETFTRVITSKIELRTATVKAYLLTVARHIFLEIRRVESRFQSLSVHDEASESLEASQQKLNALGATLKYLQTLPIDDRTAILLHASGVTYEDISRIMTISLAAAKVKVHRARKKLTLKLK